MRKRNSRGASNWNVATVVVIERTISHFKDKFIPVLCADSSGYANELFKHWAVQEFIALELGSKAIWMQVFSLKEVFLMDIFLCLWVGQYCGEGFGGGLYIYILLHVCWVVQRMNDAEGFSLCLCERKMGGQRDRKTCTHIPVFQSNCPSIFLFALVFLCIFACLHLSVSLFLSFPCPPPPPPTKPPPLPALSLSLSSFLRLLLLPSSVA